MDADEFEEFFLRVYPQLVRYVRQHYDPSVADDLASKTLETIWVKALPAPNDDHSYFKLRKLAFKVLLGHLRHHVRDEQARKRRDNAYAVDHPIQLVDPDFITHRVEPPWPELTALLTAEERHLLALVVDRYKPAEIAPILGVKPSAVTTRTQRLRRKIQELWAKEVGRDEQG